MLAPWHVVTEYGLAKLRGRSLAERARALIVIAHPDHREALGRKAYEAGLLRARTAPHAPPPRRAAANARAG
jgi:acyl-CoA hydrolase